MSLEVGQPIAADTTTQVKHCRYNEEEPAIMFGLIEAQFALSGYQVIEHYSLLFQQQPIWSPSQGSKWETILGVSSQNCPMSRQVVHSQFFCKQLLLVPIWALIFCKNSNSRQSRNPPDLFTCTEVAPPAKTFFA
jgi:hypothetical protein